MFLGLPYFQYILTAISVFVGSVRCNNIDNPSAATISFQAHVLTWSLTLPTLATIGTVILLGLSTISARLVNCGWYNDKWFESQQVFKFPYMVYLYSWLTKMSKHVLDMSKHLAFAKKKLQQWAFGGKTLCSGVQLPLLLDLVIQPFQVISNPQGWGNPYFQGGGRHLG